MSSPQQVLLSSSTAAKPTFTPSVVGNYVSVNKTDLYRMDVATGRMSPIGDPGQFLEPVRNIDDPHAAGLQLADDSEETVDLLVGGMTCASCVGRVEKKLNRLDGVEASVNLATASARVRFDPTLVEESTLVETVERTGYTATLPSVDKDDPASDEASYARSLLRRLLVSAPLTAVVLAFWTVKLSPLATSLNVLDAEVIKIPPPD